MSAGRTWMVMVRDVSHAIEIDNEPAVIVCIVLDVDTGLVLGIGAQPTRAQACRSAFETALTEPAVNAPFPAGPPNRVLCAADDLVDVGGELVALIGGSEAPAPEEIIPAEEAEDIVDSFVGHMAGRTQPTDPPTPDDWRRVVSLAHDYAVAEPWKQPAREGNDLNLVVTIDGEATHYVPLILGQDEIQRGFVLYPGTELPEPVRSSGPGRSPSVLAGTLICYLDPPDETPAEAVGRAVRYGWPTKADLVPLFVAITDDGPADIGRREAHHLALAMAAVLRQDRGTNGAAGTTGTMAFPGGEHGEYSITSRGLSPVHAAVTDAVQTGDPRQLLDLILGDPRSADMFAPPSGRRPRRDDVVTYRVRVDLKDAKPPCWRRLELASDLSLDELHGVLQATFDWFGGHLHQFGAGPTSFYHPATEHYLSEYAIEDGDQGIPESDVRLDEVLVDPGDRLFYVYDFGDDWEHVIRLEAVLPRNADAPRAICAKGRRPSPPEDCGGIWGYELITAAHDPAHADHREAVAELRDAYGPDFDPDDARPIPFDIDTINEDLRDLFD